MGKRQINWQVNFDVNKSGIEEISRSLNSIRFAAEEAKINKNITKELKEASVAAEQLENILDSAWNSKLGQLDLNKVDREIKSTWGTVDVLKSKFESSGKTGAQAYNQFATTILHTNNQVKETNKLLDKMATTMGNTIRFGISSSIFNNIAGSIQRAYNYSKDLNTSLNNIRIVTKASVEDMQDFAKEANKAAKQLGSNTLDYTDAALIYYQQGLDPQTVAARTETTLKVANVTKQATQEVSDELTAVWNGFNVKAEESELYIDKLAAVAASTASDLEQLSVGISKVASAANSMGVDVDQLNAQLSTIISVTRQAPESVGTALRTIYARMSDIKAGTDEDGVSLGNYTQKMADLGVNVLDSSGKLRDMGEVIEEVGNNWKNYTREQQVALTQTMAGQRQYNNLVALFDNWGDYNKALATSQNAVGTLQEQEDIYMESTEAHLAKLRTEAERTYSVLFDTNAVNDMSDVMSGLLSIFNNFLEGLGGGLNDFTFFGSLITNMFNKQIGGAIERQIENIERMRSNASKAELESVIRAQHAAKGDFVSGEQLEAEIGVAEKLEPYKNVMSIEQSEELLNLQQQIGVAAKEQAEAKQNYLETAKEVLNVTKEEEIDQELFNKAYEAREENNLLLQKQIDSITKSIAETTKEIEDYNGYINDEVSIEEDEFEAIQVLLKNRASYILDEIEQEKILNKIAEGRELTEKDINLLLEQRNKNIQQRQEQIDKNIAEQERLVGAGETYEQGQKSKEKRENLEGDVDKRAELLKRQQAITGTVQALSGSISLLTSMNGIIDTLGNTTLDSGEKAERFFTVFVSGIPILISTIQGLKKLEVALGTTFITNPVFLGITALVVAITGVTKAIQVNTQAKIDNAKASYEEKEAILKEVDAHSELYNKLADLNEQYKNGQINKDALKESTESLINKYKIEGTAVDKLTGNYDNLIDKIKEARVEELKQAKATAEAEKTDAELGLRAQAKQTAGWERTEDGYGLNIGIGYNQEEESKILESIKKNVEADFSEFDILGYKSFDIYTGIDTESLIKLYDQLSLVKKEASEAMDAGGLASSEAYKDIDKWLKEMKDSVEQYRVAIENIKKYSSELEIAQSEIDFYNIQNLEDYYEKRQLLEEKIAETIPDEEERTKTITAFLESEYNLSNFTKQYEAVNELVEKFGEQSRQGIISLFSSMDEQDWEAFRTLNIDEVKSLEELQNYIDLAKEKAKEAKIETKITVAQDSITSLLKGDALSKEQLEDLEKLEQEYEELGAIQDKNSREYLEKLIQIREALEEQQRLIDEEKESQLIEKISEIDITANPEEFQNTMKEIADADYEVLVDIKGDLQSDFDSVTSVMDNMEQMADKIGDDFIVAAKDLEELNDVFPGILNNMEILGDGSAQLSKESVQLAMQAAQQEANFDTQQTIQKLQNQQIELESKRDAAQQIANIASSVAKAEELSDEQRAEIDSALNTLKQDNAENSSTYEQGTQVDVAKAAGINASSMANSYAQAYKKMAEDSAKWAAAAQQNMLAAQGQGSISNGANITTGFSADTSGGTVATADKGQLKSSADIKTGTNMQDIARTYQNLANAYGSAINNVQGKIAELSARTNDFMLGTSGVASGLGSDGKSSGSGGGGSDQDTIDFLDDEIDRYHDIDIILKQIDTDLNRLEKQQDKLFGKDLVDNLNKQLADLDKQIAATTTKIEIANQEALELRGQLSGYGVTFNQDGTISNYGAAYESQLAYVNGIIASYNAMDAESQKAYKDSVENAKNNFNDFVKLIDNYDKLVTDTIPGMQDEIQDALDKQIEIRIKEFNMEIEIRLDMAEAERDWNEFKRKIIDDIKDDDILGLAGAKLQDYFSYYKADNTGIVQRNTQHVNDILNQLAQMDATGTSSIYGDNRTAALEDLEKYYKQLMSDLVDVEDLVDEIKESYLDGMDKAKDAFKDQLDTYKEISDLINHDMKVIELIYGEKAYNRLSSFYQQQEFNFNKQLDFQKQQVDFWKQQMETLEENSEEWEKAKENWVAAVNEWNSAVENAIENLQDKYLNAINEIFQNLNNEVTSGMGLEYVNEQWDLINKNADQYLDTINSMYAVQQLQKKYLDAIDNTDSISAQRKLNQLMNDQVSALEEQDKLTQYDVDRAELKYQIALKQIALQEAQQNKTTMRLKRDSQGNYSYQYVSDEDQVSSVQEEISDLYNRLYNLDVNQYQNNLDQIYSVWEEFQEKMAEAAQINDPEEREARELLLKEQYGELINGLIEQNEIVRKDLYESSFLELSDMYNTDYANFATMIESEKESLMNELIPYWDSGVQQMTDKFAGEGGFLPVCQDAFEQLNGATNDYENSLQILENSAGINFNNIQNGIDNTIYATQDLLSGNQQLISSYQQELGAIQSVIGELNGLISQYGAAKRAAEEAAQAAYAYWAALNNQAASSISIGGGGGGSYGASSYSGGTPAAISGSRSGGSGNGNGGNPLPGGSPASAALRQGPVQGGLYYISKNSAISDSELRQIYNSQAGYSMRPSSFEVWKKGFAFDTGGYTGDWGNSSGKLALLHQKELVLNENDTKNMLNAVSIIRGITENVGSSVFNQLASLSGIPNVNVGGAEGLEQNVHIDATFPGVRDSLEIQNALNNLVNVASQHIHRR